MNGQQIKHFPEFSLLQEGENFTTYCNSSSILSSLQWYKQRPGGSPVLLMILAKGREVKTQHRLTGRFGESRQHSSLNLTAAQLSDAGTYFCAEAQCSGGTCCLSPNLIVGSRGCSSSSLLRAGARESWSHDVYEEIEVLIKKKNPRLSVTEEFCQTLNYIQFLAENRKKRILHSFYEANISLIVKSDKDHKESKTTGKYLLSWR